MKVLMVCMVWLAVALAMPVAEEKLAAPIAAEVKPDSVNVEKLQADAAPATQVKSESPQALEKKEEPVVIVTPSSGLAKSADIVPKAAIPAPVSEVQPEAAAASEQAKPEEKKPEEQIANEKPQEEKAIELKSVEKEAEPKPEEAKTEEPKPEEKKPEERSAITAATVSEVPKESPKSIIAEPSIDVVSAVKNPASIADDVVDPAALIPTADQKPEAPVVQAKTVSLEKNDELSEKKPEETKPEQKSAEVPAEVPSKSISDVAIVPEPKPEKPVESQADDSLRVVRDTVDDQKAAASSEPEKTEEPAKTDAPAVSEPKAATEVKPEASPVKLEEAKKEEPIAASDAEKPKEEERSNAVAKSDKPEAPKPDLEDAAISTEKSVIASVSSSNASPKSVAETAVIDDLKHQPEVKSDNKEAERPSGDAPSVSSEESSENSGEKKTESKESSSEESSEVTKAPAKSS